MRLVFNRSGNFQKHFQLAGRNPPRDRPLERREMTVHARRGGAPSCGGPDDERPVIVGADFSCDETAVDEPIEDARQRRSLVREALVQLGDRRRRGRRQQREDVRLALREPVVTQAGEVEADPVCGAMNRWNEAERHR
jgi:hypothetical protein